MGDTGKDLMIHATVNIREAEHQSTMLETIIKINGMDISLLIDLGETKSFSSHTTLSRSKVIANKQEDFDVVEMDTNITQEVGLLVKDCEVDLGYVLPRYLCILLL